MRGMDRHAVENLGISEEILMENAGRASFQILSRDVGRRRAALLYFLRDREQRRRRSRRGAAHPLRRRHPPGLPCRRPRALWGGGKNQHGDRRAASHRGEAGQGDRGGPAGGCSQRRDRRRPLRDGPGPRGKRHLPGGDRTDQHERQAGPQPGHPLRGERRHGGGDGNGGPGGPYGDLRPPEDREHALSGLRPLRDAPSLPHLLPPVALRRRGDHRSKSTAS